MKSEIKISTHARERTHTQITCDTIMLFCYYFLLYIFFEQLSITIIMTTYTSSKYNNLERKNDRKNEIAKIKIDVEN